KHCSRTSRSRFRSTPRYLRRSIDEPQAKREVSAKRRGHKRLARWERRIPVRFLQLRASLAPPRRRRAFLRSETVSLTSELNDTGSFARRFIDERFPHLPKISRERNRSIRNAGFKAINRIR